MDLYLFSGEYMFLDSRLKNLLKDAKSIAIIGAKDKAGQPVDDVGRYLIWAGYAVYPVHPMRENVWGLTTYKSIVDIPDQIDIINVFRAPAHCKQHAEEVLLRKKNGFSSRCFWMQEGIYSPEAAELLQGHDMQVVENLCIKIVHRQLFGA